MGVRYRLTKRDRISWSPLSSRLIIAKFKTRRLFFPVRCFAKLLWAMLLPYLSPEFITLCIIHYLPTDSTTNMLRVVSLVRTEKLNFTKEFHTRWRSGPDVRMLYAVNDSHLFPAWRCGAVDDGTSHRCYQGYCDDGSRCSVMDDGRVGVDAGAVVGAGDGGTCSCHLAVPYCTLHNPLDLARVSSGLERVGDKWAQLKWRDVQGIDMTKHSKRVIEASDLSHITLFYCQLKLHDACCHIDIFTREFYCYLSYMIL